MHLVFFGPEGSGKGTQAKLIAQAMRLPVLTSGDLVRNAAKSDKGMIGDSCRKALTQGAYVADSEMFVLWKKRLKADDAKKGWILDGFPRNIHQAKFLNSKIAKYGYRIDKVIYLKLNEEKSFIRLMKRARPLHKGSSELHDSPERIRNRLKTYQKNAQKVLDYYQQLGILAEIDADGSISDVRDRIKKLFL